MSDYSWDSRFSKLFAHCLDLYRAGQRDFRTYYSAEDLAFLSAIGYQPREFFDYVEDFAEYTSPSITTAVLIAAVRRDYFLIVQKSQLSEKVIPVEDLPPKPAEWEGIPWLPRLVAKARGKLRGELDGEIMYDCGGDRKFLEQYGIHPADFLRLVWAAGDNDAAILQFVKARASA